MTVTTESAPKAPAEAKSDKLNTLHRCDRCSAQAYVEATLLSGNILMFCNHHWHKVEAGIAPYLDKEPVDERWKLTWERHKGTENS